MKTETELLITPLRELGHAIVGGKTTTDILTRVIKLMQRRMGLICGTFIMQHNTFWSAEEMLGLDLKNLSGVFGKWKTTRIFEPELGELITAEILSEGEMNQRFPQKTLFSETQNGTSKIRVPLQYRQKFIGFFYFERLSEDDSGEISLCYASIMEIIGSIIADVAETRTNQRIEREKLLKENTLLQSKLRPVSTSIIGQSDLMMEVYAQVKQVAQADATVLIRGRSGTGKELIARALVDNSQRKGKPFLTVNCAALPETLIESELFGHEKGAFTGAIERRIGRAEAADGGTLFLDEIGDLTPATQVKLLRFLQEKTFSRVGSNTEIRSNVRFIAATSRNLEELMEKKLFREDLYYRLNIFSIQLPDLSERKGDILLLAKHFIEKFNKKYTKTIKRFTPEVTETLIDWKWPGNVRELENTIERGVLTSTDDTFRVQNLPPHMRRKEFIETDASTPECDGTLSELVKQYKKVVIEKTLQNFNGNKSAAARALGITPRMMYYELTQISQQPKGNIHDLNIP